MKRIRCPKCENYLTFDETKYTEGQSLVFVCENCKKQFSIRLGKTKMKAPQKEENPDETEYKEAFGNITVIENVFGFKQVLPLQEGDNKIGRRCVGTVINVPIETSDMSMDRNHCVINVKRNKQGKLVYTLLVDKQKKQSVYSAARRMKVVAPMVTIAPSSIRTRSLSPRISLLRKVPVRLGASRSV